jgi:hypothetical protein
LTPRGRELLVAGVLEDRCRLQFARQLRVPEKTVQKCVGRFQRAGVSGRRDQAEDR